ncbi:formate-dependent phosphoribosylglycinamide formyltransferase [Corynebacterium freneyi]|uniref:Formate-dependent phosphoribosylglycinamide formyltransferase n=1 Tax=Corynebacterium freneyi TaxID=134034 RepID=A0ABS4U4G3_9CORY|nr:formate-dependent phosphoribosylglycinamide formyltransferase [Corynebacterium freneyi]MBP2331537.1 phosphoribosylglycinamide formyltransferase 2 [Corynebacterium freneyi]QXA51996.1 formate-dependent phosphoribosylglycinamide formyltransferase [Corynebacterium freneyi]UBI02207.1 formate-dependent phosphoribosylglycinamide formyltransferase [Corynebacterium freneyi]WJZ06340.1 Phosphoribosylglycinamide formyltransferase 2 [Corynebacterium freneyi]
MLTPTSTGTPYTDGATRVLLLGSGELGKEVAIAFQRLGVEVHAADRYAHAPAQQVAHFWYELDMTDADAVKALVAQVRPHFIVPEIEALATDALVELEEAGDVTVIPTARAAQLTMNREGIRRLAAEEVGLPTSRYRFASTREEFVAAVEDIGLPCVVKPVMSSSGKGQSTVRTASDVDAAWDYAMSGGRVSSGRVIVEGFVDFDYEITLLTVRSIDPATGEPATWFCEPIGHRQVDGDYVESWQPMPMSQVALDNARSVAARITGALGGRGIFGVELFVRGDDVWFSEVSPRPHDTGLVTMGTQRCSEFDLHARAILGLPIDVTLTSPGASAVVYGKCDGPAPTYSGLADALAVPETDVRIFGKPEAHDRRRMGVVVSTAEDVDSARENAARAAAAVSVSVD